MDMTHPDILRMERHGFLGKPPKLIGRCLECGELICEGVKYYYDEDERDLYCCPECVVENAGMEALLARAGFIESNA